MRNISKLALSAGAFVAAFALTGAAEAQTTGGWAIVASDGSFGHNQNVVAVNHKSAGVYLVKFNQDVSTCAANATIGGNGKRSVIPGYIVVSHPRSADTIKVTPFLPATLLPADFRFNIQVMC